jgi:hypothetical protein
LHRLGWSNRTVNVKGNIRIKRDFIIMIIIIILDVMEEDMTLCPLWFERLNWSLLADAAERRRVTYSSHVNVVPDVAPIWSAVFLA